MSNGKLITICSLKIISAMVILFNGQVGQVIGDVIGYARVK